jgi:hypothetical protein
LIKQSFNLAESAAEAKGDVMETKIWRESAAQSMNTFQAISISTRLQPGVRRSDDFQPLQRFLPAPEQTAEAVLV